MKQTEGNFHDHSQSFGERTIQSIQNASASAKSIRRALIRQNSRSDRPKSPEIIETFLCNICFENHPITFATTLECNHKFCTECLKTYLEFQIKEGRIDLECFYPMGEKFSTNVCGVKIRKDVLAKIVDEESFHRFLRLDEIAHNDRYRECPFCNAAQNGSPQNPEMTCINCRRTFCFFHSNSHEGMTCAEFEMKEFENNRAEQAELDEMSRPCPNCGIRISKNGGCNHMFCTACKHDFCWVCMGVIGQNGQGVTEHYQNGPCNQFPEGYLMELGYDAPEEDYCVLFIEMILLFPFFVVLGIPLGIIWLLIKCISFILFCEDPDEDFVMDMLEILATGACILTLFAVMGFVVFKAFEENVIWGIIVVVCCCFRVGGAVLEDEDIWV